MEEKRVRTVDDIIFEEAGITLPKGSVYLVEGVTDSGVILQSAQGDRWCIDFVTFEAGFEIAG